MNATKGEVEEIIISNLMALAGLDRTQVCQCTRLVDDRILDSLKLLEFYLILEERFGATAALASTADYQSVSRIASHVFVHQVPYEDDQAPA